MPSTYERISTTTLSSASANITFSSIPSTYTHLRIVLVGTTTVSVVPALRFNSDTGANYSDTFLYGNGTSAGTSRSSNTTELFMTDATATSTTIPTFIDINIFNYAGSTNKTILTTNSSDFNGSGVIEKNVGLWRNTSAITSIELRARSSTWKSGTIASLYGIVKA